ncbi:hypothetical protein GUITHDRAFT_109956 [Guillardia theta CCMP2712]|uniref:EGF-like domain-containing protein n=1 Tax=Guillardia theta (strain CCMP2712) TaxID=905079 RepID=L1J751_GUITC|nr:hypothetical protein GUITHDRAFT_109956 [Guillardia theta CCMP2712]EKX44172.1 hypothetical protein GUITHDRAFT_109956 [Guillardia theta CCMP2712]|eukprot:XP_005831152.1 hypothetical protein GUITHDRAFT_109956 [Guillardia theta CCMP2712]
MRAAQARLLIAVVLQSATALAINLYVSITGDDVKGDGTLHLPYKTIQGAIDASWDLDVIVLLDGHHVSDKEIRFRGRKLTVRGDSPPVTRYGSCWPVMTADPLVPTLSRCNISSFPQTWSQRQYNDFMEVGQETTVQWFPPSHADPAMADPAYHAVLSYDLGVRDPSNPPRSCSGSISAGSRWSCGLMGCKYNFSGSGDEQAAINSAVRIVGARFIFLEGDEVILRDLDIRGQDENFATASAIEGGCLFSTGRNNITVVDSVLSSCSSKLSGGAASIGFESKMTFRGVRFLNNSARNGGAMSFKMRSTVLCSHCEFSGNLAEKGGGIYVDDVSSPQFESCDFYSNTGTYGGAIYAGGRSSPAVVDSAFVHNSALDGAVIYAGNMAIIDTANCTFQNNSAERYGGVAVLEQGGSLWSRGDAMFFNFASRAGAAIYSKNADPNRWRDSYQVQNRFNLLSLHDDNFLLNTAAIFAGQVYPKALSDAVFSSSNGNKICNGRGSLDENLECLCRLPYTGVNCEVQCKGLLLLDSWNGTSNASSGNHTANATSTVVCSGHGTCLVGSAVFDTECRWFGGRSDCSQKCPGTTQSSVCSGHGDCFLENGTATCSCFFGWGGEECDEIRLYVLGTGGNQSRLNRVIRLGDKMLANNRESGLHLLVLNRTDLTVVWDYSYEVMKFEYPASQYSSERFYLFGGNDGTINVATGIAEDGTCGSLNSSTDGVLTRNPQVSSYYFGEGEANRMARDLSLFDARHLAIVSSFFAWENHTNPALLQALKRIGGPDLEPFVQDKQGSGHALIIVGIPDSGEGNGTFMLSPPPDPAAGYATSVAEVEVNLKSRVEEEAVLWCGARVYEHGVDVSHLVGTACVRDGQVVANFEDGADGIIGGGLAVEPVKTIRTETVRNETGGQVARWFVVARAPPDTPRLEAWDLLSDFDLSSGPSPLLLSSSTIVQPCCNRSVRWNHGGCRKGRTVSRSPQTLEGEILVCEQSGWLLEDGSTWPGHFGNLDLAGPFGDSLNRNEDDLIASQPDPLRGAYTPYDYQPGHRNTPFTEEDIVPQLQEQLPPRGLQDLYSSFLEVPTPTPVFKECEVGVNECEQRSVLDPAVLNECSLGQCNVDTGWEASQRWQKPLS